MMIKTRIIKTLRRRSMAGFTLLEVLVVVIIIGILFAIAAPGWTALMNRQRVNVVRDQATQVIRQAQNDARRSKLPRAVVFQSGDDPNNTTRIPRAAVLPLDRDVATGKTSVTLIDPTTIRNWQSLGNGDVRAGILEFSTTPAQANGQLVFDSNGFVDPVSINRAGSNQAYGAETSTSRLFAVKIRQKNTSAKTNRCVVVKTILGAIELAESDRCENL